MEIQVLRLGMYQSNCYVVYEDGEAFVVDPGDKGKDIAAFLKNRGLNLNFILLTHGHVDHVSGVDELVEEKMVPIYIMNEDKTSIINNIPIFGEVKSEMSDIKEGDKVTFLGKDIEVFETPGHTKGGLCFYMKDESLIFTGDTLFKHSVGRSDLYGGDGEALIRNIREKLLNLPNDTVVYPGHDDKTDIGHEMKYNMFLK